MKEIIMLIIYFSIVFFEHLTQSVHDKKQAFTLFVCNYMVYHFENFGAKFDLLLWKLFMA